MYQECVDILGSKAFLVVKNDMNGNIKVLSGGRGREGGKEGENDNGGLIILFFL